MGNTLYLECNSGISGDMTVGALLDLGADYDALIDVLEGLPVDGFFIKQSRVIKNNQECCDFDVVLDREHDNHDHDMEYLYGHEKEHDYEIKKDLTSLEEDLNHPNAHDIHARHLSDIINIIDGCTLTERARDIAIKVFHILADAEAEAHGCSVDQVHFHEVGAVDSIADIISLAFCVDNLNIDRVVITKLTDGHGTIRCSHGILQVPVPAVSNIVKKYDILLEISQIKGELVTPTGAAIAAALRTDVELPATYKIVKEGFGAGKRDYDAPCYLKASLIEPDRW